MKSSPPVLPQDHHLSQGPCSPSEWPQQLPSQPRAPSLSSAQAHAILPNHRFHPVVQSLSHVWLFATLWTAACQASLSFIISQSLLKIMSIELVISPNHLILCCPLLLLPSIFPSIRVFPNESALRIRWPKYWSSASVLPMNIQGWFPLGLTSLISLLSKGPLRVFSNTVVQKHQFFGAQPSLGSNSYICTWLLEKP